VKTRQGRGHARDGGSQAVADVVDELVGYSVPAGPWGCPGGCWRRHGAGGAERRGRGQRGCSGVDVAGRVWGARHARSGVRVHAWARLGVSVPTRLVHRLGWARVHSIQGSVEQLEDMVVHGGEGHEQSWHVCVSCHARHGMVFQYFAYSSLVPVLQ
jgi:hypothetical protein